MSEPTLDARTVLVLPAAACVPGIARRVMAHQLSEHGAGRALIHDAELVLSELVTNALKHGCRSDADDLEVSWAFTGNRLSLSVLDAGAGGEPLALQVPSESLSGRGLAIVTCLAERWHVEHERGTRVTAELAA